MKQRGQFQILIAAGIALLLSTGALALTWHLLNNCKTESATIKASYNAFSAGVEHEGRYAEAETKRINEERERISSERKKSYAVDLAAIDDLFVKLCNADTTGSADCGELSIIPSASESITPKTRNKRLLQVLRIAQRQAQQLDAVLDWEEEQSQIRSEIYRQN